MTKTQNILLNKIVLSIFFLFSALLSCDNLKHNDHDESNRTKDQQQMYKHFEGKMGNRKFSMELFFIESDVFGTLYFDDVEELRDVFGTYSSNDSLILKESIQSDFHPNKEEGDFNQMSGIFSKGRYTGSFKENSISTTFDCAIATQHQVPFDFVKYTDTIKDPNSKKNLLVHEIEIPISRRPQDEYLNTYLAQLAGIFDFNGNNKKLLSSLRQIDISDFDSLQIEEMKQHPYTLANYFDVSYNDKGLIIFSYSGLKFYGKMHENFKVRYSSINVVSKKEIVLQDVLTKEEIKKLPSVLEKKFRDKYKLTNNEKLSSILFFDENKFVNNNYYITTKGVGFQYDPHELAGFSKGLITLYVPFSEIRNKLP